MTVENLNNEIKEKMIENGKGMIEFLKKAQLLVDKVSDEVRDLVFNKEGENGDIYFRIVGDSKIIFNWTVQNHVYLKDLEDDTYLSIGENEKSLKGFQKYPFNSEKSLEKIEEELKKVLGNVNNLF